MARSAIVPSSAICTAAPAAPTAQSPTRRSTFSYALDERARIGKRISVISSCCSHAVS